MHRIAALALAVGLSCCVAVAAHAAAGQFVDGGFEQPVVPVGGFSDFSTGQTIDKWSVVGASGNVSLVSTTFSQNGIAFPAHSGHQWLDLTGVSQTATGVQQTVRTVPGSDYTLTFFVGNVVNPGGIFGTTSTVDVFMDGTRLMTATNVLGKGKNRLVWQKFTTTITATGTRTTFAFINGDPASDTLCGLDAVSLALVPPETDPASE